MFHRFTWSTGFICCLLLSQCNDKFIVVTDNGATASRKKLVSKIFITCSRVRHLATRTRFPPPILSTWSKPSARSTWALLSYWYPMATTGARRAENGPKEAIAAAACSDALWKRPKTPVTAQLPQWTHTYSAPMPPQQWNVKKQKKSRVIAPWCNGSTLDSESSNPSSILGGASHL